MAEETKIIAAVGTLSAEDEKSGSLTNSQLSYSGSVEVMLNADGEMTANSSFVGSLGTLLDGEELTGTVAGNNIMNGAAGATVTQRPGLDGEDGFSPTITIETDTKTEYVLRITDINGSYLTPNLYPDLDGLQDIETLVESKVDKDLSGYEELTNIGSLNTYQKQNSWLYVNTANGGAKKLAIGELALIEEVDDKLRTKIQTVDQRPTEDWRLGDYIFLDVQEEGE